MEKKNRQKEKMRLHTRTHKFQQAFLMNRAFEKKNLPRNLAYTAFFHHLEKNYRKM